MARGVTTYSWIVLACLLSVYVMNQWDRFLINYLYAVPISDCPSKETYEICYVDDSEDDSDALCGDNDAALRCEGVNWANCENCTICLAENDAEKFSMKYGACLTSSEYGILAGYGFVALFSVASLFAGRCADLFNRKRLVGCALLFWSCCILGQGASPGFAPLLASRLGLGLFQAFLIPPSYSIISDYFPKEMLGTANGIFSFGVYVGGGLSSLSIVVNNVLGWRVTTYVCAGIGGAIALVFLFVVREPVRGNMNKDEVGKDDESPLSPTVNVQEDVDDKPLASEVTTVGALQIVWADKAVVVLILAAGLRFFGGIGIGSFLPTFYTRKFPDYVTEYSLLNAAVVSAGGALSSFLGGFLADRWAKKQVKARAWVPAIGSVLGFIPFIGTLYFENFYASIACLFFEYLFAECWFGPAISIIQLRIPQQARGVAISLFLFSAQMIGNIAPTIFGALETGSAESLQTLLLLGAAVSYLGCAVLFCVVGRQLDNSGGEDSKSLLDEGGGPSDSELLI